MKNGVLMTIFCLINGINDVPENHTEESSDDSIEDKCDDSSTEE